MQAAAEVIELLNEQLTGELTAVNQYFLHARMQHAWGYSRLAAHTYDESIEEMRHAQSIIDRVLFLEGLPNLQRLSGLRVGETVPEQFRADLAVEHEALQRLRRGIGFFHAEGDAVSARLFEEILGDEERHVDYLETQLGLIESVGEPRYLMLQVGPS